VAKSKTRNIVNIIFWTGLIALAVGYNYIMLNNPNTVTILHRTINSKSIYGQLSPCQYNTLEGKIIKDKGCVDRQNKRLTF